MRSKISPQDAEEFTQSAALVVAGGWRQIALATRMGVPKALGLTTEEWVKKYLRGYIQYSVTERLDITAQLKAEGRSQREIARVLGVSEKTVRRDAAYAAGSQTEPLTQWELSVLAAATAADAALTDREAFDEAEAMMMDGCAQMRRIFDALRDTAVPVTEGAAL
ncbi:MAG TPA: helix-turn-helix domain-containing protein [Vicinamibacterales bacterium]|nr:helix-turn-helix domain-containing protein [Vicinamibacterales bacterium]